MNNDVQFFRITRATLQKVGVKLLFDEIHSLGEVRLYDPYPTISFATGSIQATTNFIFSTKCFEVINKIMREMKQVKEVEDLFFLSSKC